MRNNCFDPIVFQTPYPRHLVYCSGGNEIIIFKKAALLSSFLLWTQSQINLCDVSVSLCKGFKVPDGQGLVLIWYFMIRNKCLQFVQVVIQSGYAFFQTFAFSNIIDNLEGFGVGVTGVSLENLPVVEYTLREGLASSVAAQVSCEP